MIFCRVLPVFTPESKENIAIDVEILRLYAIWIKIHAN